MVAIAVCALALVQASGADPSCQALPVLASAASQTITIAPPATVVTISNPATAARQVWMPLDPGKAPALSGGPAGATRVSCKDNGVEMPCAAWTVAPGATVEIPLAFIDAYAGGPARLLGVDERGAALATIRLAFATLVELNDEGFSAPRTRATPLPVWATETQKKGRATAALVLANQSNTRTLRVYFRLNLTRGASGVQTPILDLAPQVTLIYCPMTPAVCGMVELLPGDRRTVPVELLERFRGDRTIQLLARLAGGLVPPADITHVTLDPLTPPGRQIPSRQFDGTSGAVVPLDNTGIVDWNYLNPRTPPKIDAPGWTVFGFENRTGDRTFVVSVPVNETAGEPLKIDQCKHVDGRCALLTVSPGTTQTIPLAYLFNAERPVIRFQAAFFEETTSPAYAVGYARMGDSTPESPSRMAWGVVGQISGTRELEFEKDDQDNDKRIDAVAPHPGRTVSLMTGVARLNAKPNLGDRADADIDLLFKQSPLGGKDARLPGSAGDLNAVSVPKYRFTVYGSNGVQLSLGKFTFVDSTLVTEAGEGFRLNWRNFGVARLLKRESAKNVADRDNDDHDLWIGQANNLLARSGPLRSINVTAIYGHDRAQASEKRYWTYGGEAFFAVPGLSVKGSGGAFRSRKRVATPTGMAPHGDGTVWLLTATRSWLGTAPGKNVRTVRRSLGLTAAGGSNDRPETAAFDEGYLGESTKFAPDIIFLASFDQRLGPKPLWPRAGLSGKSYWNVAFTEEALPISPLTWIAEVLKIKDVISQRTVARLHGYRYATPMLGVRDPGHEWSVEFQIETPKGVRCSLAFSSFMSGTGLDAVFTREPIRVVAFLQVQM